MNIDGWQKKARYSRKRTSKEEENFTIVGPEVEIGTIIFLYYKSAELTLRLPVNSYRVEQ
jgi:hypothetical protein